MSHAPLVSVVMPVYNHENYVVEAIRSVFEQSLRPIELIMIDDGSTDDSVKRIETYLAENPAPEGVSVHFNTRNNQGAHHTINEGLAASKGEYIAILNSDDRYMSERLAKCVATAKEHRARMVFTYVDPIDDDGNPLSHDHRWRSWYADVKMEELDVAPSISSLLLRYNITISTGNFVFHRSLLEDVGYFEDFRYAHDVDYALRVCLLEEPVILREKLYCYRVHTANTIAESNERITKEYAEIVRRYLKKALTGEAKNPFAPNFKDWAYSLAASSWPEHLSQAVDQLMAYSKTIDENKTDTKKPLLIPTSGVKKSTTRSHITLVSHELSHTGAPVLLRDVAMALHENGASTNLISLGEGPLSSDFEAIGSPVSHGSKFANVLTRAGNFLGRLSHDNRIPRLIGKGLRVSGRVAAIAGSRLRIISIARKAKGTLLINSFASWPIALQLLKRWKGPAYWYIHETYEPGLVMRNERSHQRLHQLIERGVVSLLFGSDATRQVWANEGLDGKVLYWSGIPAKEGTANVSEIHKPAQVNRRVILSVQSASTRKGTRSLIEAFALGRKSGWIPEDVELRIIGCHPPSRNPLSRDLLCRVHEEDLRGSVSLVRGLPPSALEAHYRATTIYVQSSIMECLPLALLTAMAHGLPIVSTDADGCREAIIEGITGRLVPQRQTEAMARAIGDLLANPQEGQILGNAARSRFEEMFALDVTAPALIETIAPELRA